MDTELAAAWGRAIRAQRKLRGLSQEQFAAEVGVAQATVSRWESGKAMPPHRLIPTIADVLGTVASVLFQYPIGRAS
jgi:transcriptional regulator with XRE-family HTH domain